MMSLGSAVLLQEVLSGGHSWRGVPSQPSAEVMANPLRGEVVKLYKNLLYLGREYPKGEAYFKERLKKAFMKNKDVTDPEKIKELIARGEFVVKEIEALYFLRKYRAMKQRYYDDDPK